MSTSIVIFLFHRDLRLEDNIPLQQALDYAKEHNTQVLPVFVFTPAQVGKSAIVKSVASVACLIQSVEELHEVLTSKYKSGLCIMYDDTIKALEKIRKVYTILSIFETKDYTPFAKKREENIEKFCKKQDIHYEPIDYLFLYAPGSILNGSGKPYQKFTPFYNASKKFKVPKPEGFVKGEFMKSSEISKLSDLSVAEMKNKILTKSEYNYIKNRQQIGGRKEGLQLLKSIPKDYDKIRDQFASKTSHLSVHLHNGTVSVREVWYNSSNEEFKRQLVWRDFYGQLMDVFDELYQNKKYKEFEDFQEWLAYRPKLTKAQQKDLEHWKAGTTGIEIVDASMAQMNQTHYMINRGRLIVSNYLIKTMKVPWQYGAEYFAEKLLDYDYVNNSMNWLFIAGGFPFSEAPFRVYNPENFEKKFDKDKEYIHTWLNNSKI
jgi:deoxyribodipyrimidine photo-lyase